jgi:hypothetical protein
MLRNLGHKDGSPLTDAERNAIGGASQDQIDKFHWQLAAKLTADDIKSAAVSAATVIFGNNPNQDYHTFRHVEDAGIDKQSAEDAVRKDLAGRESSLPQGLTKGEVNVGGKTIEYHAYKLPDGTINVGRITVK